MKRRAALLVLAAGLCLACAGCSTSALTNAESYFDNVGSILEIMVPSRGSGQSTPSGNDEASALAVPTDFAMDEEGNFSFTGVENAGFYILYFCAPDTPSDSEEYLYQSGQILPEAGTDTCSGFYRDVIDAPYGEYLVRVVAVPELGDEAHSMSSITDAPSVHFTAVGAQSAPEFEYFWDPFTTTLSFQLSNIGTYTYEAYPAHIDITMTNVNDNADQVVVRLEDVSEENTAVSTNALTQGQTYAITAVAVSGSDYVTTPNSETAAVSDGLTLGELNILTDGYTYSSESVIYPLVWEGFDLVNGGAVGELMGFNGVYSFNCTPAAASDGSAYSYTVSVNAFVTVPGGLELHEDGTAEMYLTGYGPVGASSITGVWLDNGDGTATLNFSLTSWSS